jgi:aminoglycoside phosphotransferase (APT) family kinase protein
MPSGTQRDLAALEPRLLAWLRARHPDRAGLHANGLRHASAGLTNETLLLDVSWNDGTQALVVRLPAEQITFPGADLAIEAHVQEAVARVGVPAPVPATFEPDVKWVGAPFLAMPFVAGQVGPQTPAFDPWIASLDPRQQRRVFDGFLDVMAGVHGIDPVDAGLGKVLRGASRSVSDELTWWEEYARWAGVGEPPDPIVVELLAWCRANLPAREPPPSLLWGDPRLGNAIFDDDPRIVAALDWDMAFIGPAEHDAGWFFGLEGVMAAIAKKRVVGFPAPDDAIASYEARLGRRLVDYEWYEIFALVRSIAITVRQIKIAADAGVEYLVPPPDRSPVVPYVRELIARAG